MGIGQRRQVQLVPMISTKNASGSWLTVEGDKVGVWAEVTDPSGNRGYLNGQTQINSSKNFLIRFRFDKFPNCDWKIIYDGKQWTITERRKIDEKQFYWRIAANAKSDV